MSLTVEIKGLPELQQDIKRAGGDAKPLVKAALFNSVTRMQRNIRERAPHKTGSLQRSILTQVDYPNAQVSADEKYAEYVEYGTKPHIIMPKNKKALYWKGAFSPVTVVHHPGTKANPFFKTGVENSQDYINEVFLKVIDRLVSELAGRA
jgi:HK97 gp10 family phage protein